MLIETIKRAKEMCEEGGHKLLFLTKYGSHLYGTNTLESDLDVAGIYAPSYKSLFTVNSPESLHYTSGNNYSKNSNSDVDIKLYSIQYWLYKKLRSMDINALDVFFAINDKNSHIFKNRCMDELYKNRSKILSVDEIMNVSYLQYARKQVKKYGLKGTKVWVYLKICKYIEDMEQTGKNISVLKLKDIYEDLILLIEDESLVSLIEKFIDPNIPEENKDPELLVFLKVAEQLHDLNISIKEFYKRIKVKDSQLGSRAHLAMENNGVDWKACSHAVRAITQVKDFYITGSMNFPVANSDVLISIKKGELNWQEVEMMINSGLEEVSQLRLNDEVATFCWDCNYVDEFITNLYGDLKWQKPHWKNS